MCLGSFHQAWGDDFECCTSGLLTGSSRIKDLPTGLSQLEHNIIVCQWGRPWNRIYLPSRKKLLFSFVQGKRENRLMVSSHLLGIWWTQGFTQVYILYELGSLIFFLEIKSLLITEYLLASKWQKQNLNLDLFDTKEQVFNDYMPLSYPCFLQIHTSSWPRERLALLEGGVFPFYPGLWTPCSQSPCQKQEQLNANWNSRPSLTLISISHGLQSP